MSNSVFLRPDENGNWGKISSFQEIATGQTLQNAATSTGNGAVLDCLGYSAINLTISNSSGSTIALEGSLDGTNFFSVWDSTGMFQYSSVYSLTSLPVPVSGFRYFRARISAYYGGSVTVVAYLSTVPPQSRQRVLSIGNEGISFYSPFDYIVPSVSFPYIYNGNSFDRHRSNVGAILVFGSATRTSTATSSDLTNYNHRGIYILLNVTSASGTGGLQIRVMAKNSNSVVYTQINTLPTAITAAGSYVVQVYPSIDNVNSNITQTISQTIPRTFRLDVVHGDASNYTYSLSVDFIV